VNFKSYGADMTNRTALITGASRGFGRAVARSLAADGWQLVLDARRADALTAAAADLPRAIAIAGDIADPHHRAALVQAAIDVGGLDLVVNNASVLGPSPQPTLRNYPLDVLRHVYEVNVVAPLALAQLTIPLLAASHGAIVNITSDAAVEPYEGWGGYGSSKAALEQLTAILAAEHPDLRIYTVDPGDMRTQMQQDAFPGEDISDRPPPEESVPGLLALIEGSRPSGRYQARELR
jgi:NAD(P)-dependent dehydrogenase (short-subunit alcohol dehydrogenase family)